MGIVRISITVSPPSSVREKWFVARKQMGLRKFALRGGRGRGREGGREREEREREREVEVERENLCHLHW